MKSTLRYVLPYLNSFTSQSASTSGGLEAHKANRGPQACSRTGPGLMLTAGGDDMMTAANSLLLPRLCCTWKRNPGYLQEVDHKHCGREKKSDMPLLVV